jgi:uncharacterized membrane protein YgcG
MLKCKRCGYKTVSKLMMQSHVRCRRSSLSSLDDQDDTSFSTDDFSVSDDSNDSSSSSNDSFSGGGGDFGGGGSSGDW